MQTKREGGAAYGWRIVAAAFVLAMFGWGLGFYGPPVYLHAVREARGWPVAFVSTAVTVHFLVGAIAVANLPAVYRRYGVAVVTKIGALALAIGIVGWAVAAAPWQLLAATLLSGVGWAATGAAALNAIVSPWFSSHAARSTLHGLQRRKRRGCGILPALGRGDFAIRIPTRGGRHWRHHGALDLGDVRPAVQP